MYVYRKRSLLEVINVSIVAYQVIATTSWELKSIGIIHFDMDLNAFADYVYFIKIVEVNFVFKKEECYVLIVKSFDSTRI